jgi:hypothetical protein
MGTTGWLKVPVGRDAAHWRTADTRRSVLGVVHTVACADAVLDAIELIEPDPRVQVVFTQAPDVFSVGVREHLRALGAVTIPWDQATETDFDLAVAADCAGTHDLHAPVLALAHGVVNNKLAPAALGGPASELVVGLAAPWLTWYGRLVPAGIAVSHHDAIAILRRQCPQAVPVAEVTGDLTLDRLLASAAHRDSYRRALGVDDRRIVVAVSSTWGPGSLFGGDWQALFDRLSELPPSHYGVRVVMHPAVWFGHGPRQVLAWLHRHRRAGFRVVEPGSWRGLVVGADVLIGDHGSATVYAAAAGVPVLRAGVASRFTARGSAGELLSRLAPVLVAGRPVSDQLHAVMRAGRADPDRRVAAAVSSRRPGQAAALLRSQMYRLMALAEPAGSCSASPVAPPALVGVEEVSGG